MNESLAGKLLDEIQTVGSLIKRDPLIFWEIMRCGPESVWFDGERAARIQAEWLRNGTLDACPVCFELVVMGPYGGPGYTWRVREHKCP